MMKDIQVFFIKSLLFKIINCNIYFIILGNFKLLLKVRKKIFFYTLIINLCLV